MSYPIYQMCIRDSLNAVYALEEQGMDIGPLIGLSECGVKVETNLTKMLEAVSYTHLQIADNYGLKGRV